MWKGGFPFQWGTMLPVKPDIKWRLAAQIGVILNLTAGPITKAAPELSGQLPPWD